MDNNNPFAPPAVASDAIVPPPAIVQAREATPVVRRRLALILVAFSIGCSLTYMVMDEVILTTSVGAWPMLLATAAIGIVAGFLTRDWIVAPFCCFCGTMSGDILAGVVRGWSYAQLELCIPLAIGFSIPALIVAAVTYWRGKRSAAFVG